MMAFLESLFSDVISGGLLATLAHFAWPWAPTVRW